MAALERASHYLRRELAVRLSLRYIPELRFELDRHPDAESRVAFLLKKARRSRGKK
jgi:ribosome-binding factor A